MSINTRYTYTNPTISKMLVDQTNGFVWLAFNKGSDGYCHLKMVSANNLSQVYYDISITADKILDLQTNGIYIYALLLNSSSLIAQFSIFNPFTNNSIVNSFNYSKPFGIPTPLAIAVDSSNVYILLPDESGGISPKILHFGSDGGYQETIDLNILHYSNGTLTNVSAITVDSFENIWITTYTNPVKLGRVWFASGGWNMQVTSIT